MLVFVYPACLTTRRRKFATGLAEPIYVQLHMYEKFRWEFIYSAPIYVAIGILVKGIVDRIEIIEKKANGKGES